MNLYRSSSYSFVYKQAWGIFLFDKKKTTFYSDIHG